ncbi:LysR family transcriptional regulator [Planktotalea sp.]|uniref:LysR family transcriptional regulator n=1 Tax=Planktotalea sp. TaxID=2029877 RepID=UPI003F6AF051
MRFKRLDLNLLVALDHMLELRSVSAAAEKMFMSQSAMSNALTRIRTYFDDPLLVQVGRRMELTPRAEALRPAIRDILVRVEATIDTELEFDPAGSKRIFNVLLSDYSMRILMPHVFAMAHEQKASVGFNLLPQTGTPYTLLERGEVDLLVTPEQFTSKDHPAAMLFQDEYVVVACKRGAYADVKMDKSTFEAASHVAMVPPNNAGAVESEILGVAGITRKVDVTSFSFSNLPHLVVGTDRIATIHKHLANIVAERSKLSIYPLPVESPILKQMIQWHAYRDLDPGITWLRSLFESAAKRMIEHSQNQ